MAPHLTNARIRPGKPACADEHDSAGPSARDREGHRAQVEGLAASRTGVAGSDSEPQRAAPPCLCPTPRANRWRRPGGRTECGAIVLSRAPERRHERMGGAATAARAGTTPGSSRRWPRAPRTSSRAASSSAPCRGQRELHEPEPHHGSEESKHKLRAQAPGCSLGRFGVAGAPGSHLRLPPAPRRWPARGSRDARPETAAEPIQARRRCKRRG